MGCSGCSCSSGKDGVSGCKSGGCASGGCNRHNSYDWIAAAGIKDPHPFDVVEVSFKNGSSKQFYKNAPATRTETGDYVLVESASGGYDLGKISLTGELVRLQLKKKRIRNDAKLGAVIRKAHERDLEKLDELRQMEKNTMVRARAIARMLDLNMKIGDVEFQGDGRKATFFYTADGRVDFRELIRHYAKEFKVKIEMRQIGARQESSRIGGLGNCGRELCCSTWLTDFKSVNTSAARYQNLAINQTKLSGMCGRLKCCLNYELDTYLDALEDFPDHAERFKTVQGLAILMKTDVFKRLMFYTYEDNRSKFYPLHVDQVWEAIENMKKGVLANSLEEIQMLSVKPVDDDDDEQENSNFDFENVHNVIQLPQEDRRKRSKSRKNRNKKAKKPFAPGQSESSASGTSTGQPSTPPPPQNQRPPQNQPTKQGNNPPQQRPQQPNQKPQQPNPKNQQPNQKPPQQPNQKPQQPNQKPPQNQPKGNKPNNNPNRPNQPPRPDNPNHKDKNKGGGNPNSKDDSRNKPPKAD